MALFLIFCFSYLIGSIPFGVILVSLAKAGNLAHIGSGNIGATNVLRTGKKILAASTLILDIFKGFFVVLFASIFLSSFPFAVFFAGSGSFLGHIFPIWNRFKGGKGVATYVGVLAGFSWVAAILFCSIWIIVALRLRYSSLSSLCAVSFTPLILCFFDSWPTAFFFAIMSLFVWIRHLSNLKRLYQGEEPKIR